MVKDFIEKAKRWPNIDSIRDGIRSMYSIMEPILSFFSSLEDVLNHEECIPEEAM